MWADGASFHLSFQLFFYTASGNEISTLCYIKYRTVMALKRKVSVGQNLAGCEVTSDQLPARSF